MKSKTRRFIDDGQPYVNTMDPVTLWEYFQKADGYKVKKGKTLFGFVPEWMGEFYALFQWENKLSSEETIRQVPFDFLKKAYPGLHDLDLLLAVDKVGGNQHDLFSQCG